MENKMKYDKQKHVKFMQKVGKVHVNYPLTNSINIDQT